MLSLSSFPEREDRETGGTRGSVAVLCTHCRPVQRFLSFASELCSKALFFDAGFRIFHFHLLMMVIKDVTETKKEQPPSLLFAAQGLGMGEKQKVTKETHVSMTLDKLREQTREAAMGI
jgi:hypothetical protein